MRPVVALALLLPAAAHAADIAPHRAEYDLVVSLEGAGMVARGAYVIDLDRTCDAWVINDRLEATGTAPDGTPVRFLFINSVLEQQDGARFDFDRMAASPGAPPIRVAGHAERAREGEALVVRFDGADESLSLPPRTMLPTAFMAALLDAAQAGEPRFAGAIFDGDNTMPRMDIVSWIHQAGPVDLDIEGAEMLRDAPFWRFESAHYDRSQSDAAPVMEQSSTGAANGAFLTITMTLGPLVFEAKATRLAWHDDTGC